MPIADAASSILMKAVPAKSYGSSAVLAARHFYSVPAGAKVLELAEEFRRRPELEVVAVVEEGGAPRGLIARAALFDLLGKPFGLEILGRMVVSELAEPAPAVDMHASIFAVADEALGDAAARPYRILVDEAGRFSGILSARDLSEYLSRITQEDIELAGVIQSRLEECNEVVGDPRYSFDAWSRAAKGVGGDFWFTKRMEDGLIFLILCDISGKGVAASLVVSMVWGMLLMYDFGRGLRPLIIGLNESIVATFRLERYLTGFFAVYDPSTGDLAVADMGHAHEFLFRGGRAFRLKSDGCNIPIGIEASVEPAIARWRLKAGDSLFVYSDGLLEQEDSGGEEYGEGRLASAVGACLASGGALRHFLPEALDAHRGKIPQQDDMSFICLTVT
jgi:sigma-B regulation protein RsbU (phosphoserine phosphatase)